MRSPDGYARTKKHEEQHVKNFRTKFPDFLAKEFGDVSMTMTRDECSARMKLIDKGKIIKGWESEKIKEMFHHGDEWDDWRNRHDGKSWCAEGDW